MALVLSAAWQVRAEELPQVFQIVADDCSHTPRRVQTGFVAVGYDGILTALHGVLDCDTIKARQVIGAQHESDEDVISDLEIKEVDLERDVGLLRTRSGEAIAIRGLTTGPSPVQGQRLTVVGHPQTLVVQHRLSLTVESTEKHLSDLLPTNDAAVIQALLIRASPAVGIRVLSLTDGHLQPGHSGAPIIDGSGRVVAIGNGGLKGGTVEIGWGIPIHDLDLQPKSHRKGWIKEMLEQNSSLLFEFALEEALTFSVSPARSNPGDDLVLSLSAPLESGARVYLDGRGPLPKRTLQEGKSIRITIPGDTRSGEYALEIRQAGRQYMSSNKVTIENWLDRFSFSVDPQRAQTGQDVVLRLSYPAPSRYFQIFIRGNYGRVDRRLVTKDVRAGGKQVVVTIPDDITDNLYSIVLQRGSLRFSAPVCIDNPRVHRATPAC